MMSKRNWLQGGFVGAFLLLCPGTFSPWGPRVDARDRGDANDDGVVDIGDVIRLFHWLTRNEQSGICRNAADVNADGKVDYSDAVYILQYLFGSGTDPVPFPPSFEACVEAMRDLELRRLELTVLSPASAMATWETAFPSTTSVKFGLHPNQLGFGTVVDEQALYHQALLGELRPGTTYYYLARSETPDGLGAESEVQMFRTLEDTGYNVSPDHPRIFFTRSELPEIKRSLADGGSKRELWNKVTQWCDAHLDTPARDLVESDNVDGNVQTYAFAALVTGEKSYRAKAFETALYLADEGPGEELRGATEAMTYVYDWLHGDLPDGARDRLLRAIVRNCQRLDGLNRDDEFVTGMTHGNHKSMLLGALAVHGDDPKTEQLLEKAVSNYRFGFLATWRRFAGSDGGSSKGWWYTSYVLPFELEFFAAWRSATGQDFFQSERTWCEGLLDWFLYALRGDDSFFREGDAKVFDGLNYQDRHYGLLAAKEYGSSRAQWFARKVEGTSPVWGPHAVFDILWGEPDVEPEPPSGPTSRLFRNAGVSIMRESWDTNAVLASFRSAEAYTLGHTHRDNCSFTLFYKGGLALDSGIYDDFGSKHHKNYYTRTVAHNTITVFDPEEEFSLYGEVYANDGGQRWLTEGKDVPNHWPARAEETIDRASGYRLGGIVRYEDTDEYTYTVGNGAPSYNRKKLKTFHRHLLWLKQVEGWDHPVALVFDNVVSTNPSFRKAYLLHTENKPIVKGGLVTARNGEGKLFHMTLVPRDAELTVIGGSGKEFWVNGRNYPPERPAHNKEEAGGWRVEVSPSVESRDDRFLHALFPADAGTPAPAEAASFTAGKMQVCELAQWTVLFDFGGTADTYEYPNRRAGTAHLVFGAVPQSSYDLFLNGVYRGSVSSSFAGTLRFDAGTVGQVKLVRVDREE